ncbi:DNA primase subunit pri2 [Saitoella coloradoensis]
MFRSTGAKKRKVVRNFDAKVQRHVDYPHRLNFYLEPPRSEITLENFELWAINRLKVLGEIESSLFRGKKEAEMEATLKPLLDELLPLNSNNARTLKGSTIDEERKRDHYSHFILRLAFCRSEELRARFVRAETTLFKIRFAQEDVASRLAFIESLNFDWDPVSEEEKRALMDKLMAASGVKTRDEPFFKVPFERVTELVSHRLVYLSRGFAYVPVSAQQTLVFTEFSQRLEKALELTARALPRLDEDDRLVPILNHLSLGFTAPEYTASTTAVGEVTAAQVDSLVGHMPMCMRNLHTALRKNKHLKYGGREQYSLFLKGIGLSIEEALIFWRSSFSLVTDDKFNKDYRYNIRHKYGLEGARKDYKPMSCQTIILGNPPGAGDAHGCPFRHFSIDNLVAGLGAMGIHDQRQLNDIKQLVGAQKYHVACTKVFEYTHPQLGDGGLKESISHPNRYFEQGFEMAKNSAVSQ